MCRIVNVCCLPAPAHQTFSFTSLGLSAPEEACSRNVRASGTLKFGVECIFKSKMISKLIQSDPTSCPQNQKRNN